MSPYQLSHLSMKLPSTSHANHVKSAQAGFTPTPKNFGVSLQSKRGFTLIEILIVLGLVAVLASMGVIMGFDSILRSTVHSERDIVVLMLTGARARALANINESAQGVHITDSTIHLFEGASYPGTNDRSTNRNSNTTVDPEPATIVFSQLRGNATDGSNPCNPCTITLTDGSQTAIIEINSEGRIEW